MGCQLTTVIACDFRSMAPSRRAMKTAWEGKPNAPRNRRERPEILERTSRTILLNGVGWTARKTPATGEVFFLDSLMATDSEILLSLQQHSDLSSIAQSRSLPAGYVFRAKLILMLAEGASFNAIKRQLQTTAPTIVRWKQRFRRYGSTDSTPTGQKPRVLTAAVRARIAPTHKKSQRRVHALVLPQAGYSAGREQRRRASGLATSRFETAPSRTRHGQRRSPIRNKAADILGLI